jgi:hypothetical protein
MTTLVLTLRHLWPRKVCRSLLDHILTIMSRFIHSITHHQHSFSGVEVDQSLTRESRAQLDTAKAGIETDSAHQQSHVLNLASRDSSTEFKMPSRNPADTRLSIAATRDGLQTFVSGSLPLTQHPSFFTRHASGSFSAADSPLFPPRVESPLFAARVDSPLFVDASSPVLSTHTKSPVFAVRSSDPISASSTQQHNAEVITASPIVAPLGALPYLSVWLSLYIFLCHLHVVTRLIHYRLPIHSLSYSLTHSPIHSLSYSLTHAH